MNTRGAETGTVVFDIACELSRLRAMADMLAELASNDCLDGLHRHTVSSVMLDMTMRLSTLQERVSAMEGAATAAWAICPPCASAWGGLTFENNMQQQKYGTRDLIFGIWRRVRSLERFVGVERASQASVIDIDATVFLDIDGDRQPLALFELARDVGQNHKATTAITALAKRSGLPAYCVLYKPASIPNPCDPRAPDIASFRVRRIHPRPETEWRTLPPSAFAEAILQIRAWSARVLDHEVLRAANENTDQLPPEAAAGP